VGSASRVTTASLVPHAVFGCRFALLSLTQKEIRRSNFLLYKMLPSALVVQLKEVGGACVALPPVCFIARTHCAIDLLLLVCACVCVRWGS
jgi:hypothetical protein